MYSKLWNLDGFRFQQEMDLTTDAATYRDLEGNLLMTVDSSGNCTDNNGEPFGAFRLNYGTDQSWYYEGAYGTIIQSAERQLFDKAEPVVIAKLFGC